MRFGYYWGAAAMLLPFLYFNNQFNDVRVCRDFLMLAFTCVSVMLFPGHARVPVFVKTVLIGLCVLIWTCFDSFYHAPVIQQMTYFTILIMMCINMIRNIEPEDFDIIRNFIRVALIIQCIFCFTQYFGYNIYNPNVHISYVVGSLGQQTLTAAWIAVCLPFTFTRRWFPLCLLSCVCLWMLSSAMATLSAVGAMAVFVFLKYPLTRKPLIIGFIASCVMLFIYRDSSFFADHDRFLVWSITVREFLSWDLTSQLFGRGFGYFWVNFKCPDCTMGRFVHAHNDYLEVLWSIGVLGSLSLLSLLLYPLRRMRLAEKTQNVDALAAVTAVLIDMVGNFPLFISPIAIIIICCYTILMKQHEETTWQQQS